MELADMINRGLHRDPITLHAITRKDPFSAIVREVLFDRHPVLSRGKINAHKYNNGGQLIIDTPESIGEISRREVLQYIDDVFNRRYGDG